MLPISAPAIEDGAVLVTGEVITWVGTAAAAPVRHAARPGGDVAAPITVVPLGDAVLMPGLINAHSHLELTTLRGFLEGLDFREWLRTLTAVRRDLLTDADLLDAARTGLIEGLRHGITTYADCTDSAMPLQAMRELGVRGIGYVELFGPDPAQRDNALARLRARVDRLRAFDTPLVQTGISPHAPYTVSAALFRGAADFARAERLPMAVHVAESAAETAYVCHGAGPFAERLIARGIAVAPQASSPVALLADTEVLAAQPLLIHAIHVDDDDLQRIADHGARIVHCPISNAKLGQGMAPLDRMLAHDIAVGLGTDSVASNDRQHLVDEARQATLVHAIRSGSPDSLPAHEALRLATSGGAAALGLDLVVGTLEVGKAADLAAFPLDDPSVSPVYDPAVALVHALAGRAQAALVTVAGQVLVRDGLVLNADPIWHERQREAGTRLRQWRQRGTA